MPCSYYDDFPCAWDEDSDGIADVLLDASTVTGSSQYTLNLNFCVVSQHQLRCPVDCIGNWTEWTPREDYMWRTYEIIQPAMYGGSQCECECGEQNNIDVLDDDCFIDLDCGTNCDQIPNNPNGTRPDNTPCI